MFIRVNFGKIFVFGVKMKFTKIAEQRCEKGWQLCKDTEHYKNL